MEHPGRSSSEAAGRLFVGIALPPELRDSLAEHLRHAAGTHSLPGRPVPPGNWHLTLRFLGKTERAAADRLRDHLSRADLGAGFDLGFGGWGAFPRAARASVLWLGVQQGGEPLKQLAVRVERTARESGFSHDDRPLHPHLTLSRVQPARDVRPLLGSMTGFSGSMRVVAVALFRSHLGRGPARYEVVEEWRLARVGL